MNRVLPILFNTEMVRAILRGDKTVTRRIAKPCKKDKCGMQKINRPYEKGYILYVRETWQECCRNYIHNPIVHSKYCYKASVDSAHYGCIEQCGDICKWHPSIHMPKEAARIWLKVTDVRVERLQDITEEQAKAEGVCGLCYDANTGEEKYDMTWFKILWDSTIKKSDLDTYGLDANPWVWVIEFKRCEKPE